MKTILLFGLLLGAAPVAGWAQSATPKAQSIPDKTKEVRVLEASCGQCRLGLPGKGCELAVRLPGGNAYFVDGTHIDSHGDAHAQDGFCEKIRQAQVQGDVVNGRFVATYFRLLPEAGKAK